MLSRSLAALLARMFHRARRTQPAVIVQEPLFGATVHVDMLYRPLETLSWPVWACVRGGHR